MKSLSLTLLLVMTTLLDSCAGYFISFTHDDKQQPNETVQEEAVSREDLFDMLVPNNTISEEEGESFPPLSVAEHYALSWTVIMSFSKHASANDDDYGTGTSKTSSKSLDNLFWDHKSQFKFRFQMKCPSASRMVIGLIDDQGKRQRVPGSHQHQANDITSAGLHDVSCGPPIDMSRNILNCRGIPGGDTLQLLRNTSKTESNDDQEELYQYGSASSLQQEQQQQYIFQAKIEVSCLGYVDLANYRRTASGETPPDFFGLTLSSPKQQQIKARSDDLIITESFHATRITNLTRYLGPSSKSEEVSPGEKATDSSGFICQRGAAVNDIDTSTTTSPGRCSHGDNNAVGSMMEPKGMCTRQLTCYYSAPSPRRSCTSSVESLTLSSSGAPNRKKRRRKLLPQNSIGTYDGEHEAEPTESTATRRKSSLRMQQTHHHESHRRDGHRHLASKKKEKTWLHHEARYRLLWSAFNFGCDGFPIMIDISCSNAAFISFQGSSSVMRGRGSSVKLFHNDETVGNNSTTYWDGGGEQFVEDELQQQFSLMSSSPALSSLECFNSLFQENTIHCRRSIPSSLSGVSLSAKQQSFFYQEVLALDVLCTQAIDKEEDALPNVIQANTVEASNIHCSSLEEVQSDKTNYKIQAPAQVGSALTIVPVTARQQQQQQQQQGGVDPTLLHQDSGGNGSNSSKNVDEARSRSPTTGGNFVLFPPPQSGSTVDPTSSVTCSSCQNSYDFYVNYDNSIGNKVAQLVKGCLTIAACQLGTSSDNDNSVNNSERNGCINTFPPTSISYQDNDNTQFLSQLHEVSSSPEQLTHHSQRMTSILFSVATAFALIWIGQ